MGRVLVGEGWGSLNKGLTMKPFASHLTFFLVLQIFGDILIDCRISESDRDTTVIYEHFKNKIHRVLAQFQGMLAVKKHTCKHEQCLASVSVSFM